MLIYNSSLSFRDLAMHNNKPHNIDQLLHHHFKNKKKLELANNTYQADSNHKNSMLDLAKSQAQNNSETQHQKPKTNTSKYVGTKTTVEFNWFFALAASMIAVVGVAIYIHHSSNPTNQPNTQAQNTTAINEDNNNQSNASNTLSASDITEQNVFDYLQNNSVKMAEVIQTQDSEADQRSSDQHIQHASSGGIQIKEAKILPADTDIDAFIERESIKNSH